MIVPIVAILVVLFASYQIYKKIKSTKPKPTIEKYKNQINIIHNIDTELQNEDYDYTIKFLLLNLKTVYDCDYLIHIDKHIQALEQTLDKLKSIYNPYSHNKHVNAAKELYKDDELEPLKQYQYDIICNFQTFDAEKLRRNKYTEIVVKYIEYWDVVLADYIRESARVKRRKYLIEKIEIMKNCCSAHGYDDLISRLSNYQDIQKALLLP